MERFYMHSPVAVQNLMVSAYGLVLWARRYGDPLHRRLVASIAAWEKMDAAEIARGRDRLLHATILQAAKTPYYRVLFAREGIIPQRMTRLAALTAIPPVSKETVRSQTRAFMAEDKPAPLSVNTSGTSGAPLTVHCDRLALLRNYAHFTRLKQRLGIGARDRCATFAGRTLVEPWRTAAPFWRHNLIARTTLYSTYHMAPQHLAGYAAQLMREAPAMIDSYPSALGLMAGFLREHPQYRIRPKAIITSSETLQESQRAMAEAAFDCPVTDQYGSAEMVAFIAQCEHGRYHVWPSYGVCEVLVQGRPARPGESGELVCTGFINRTMPLLRYRTGDAAVLGDGCGCGLPFQVLERIEGRMDDLLITADGRQVGRLDPVFKGVDENAFLEAQIVQETRSRVVLRFVPGSQCNDLAVQRVRNEIKKRLGPTVEVHAEAVAALPRGANGKLKAVVCQVNAGAMNADAKQRE